MGRVQFYRQADDFFAFNLYKKTICYTSKNTGLDSHSCLNEKNQS